MTHRSIMKNQLKRIRWGPILFITGFPPRRSRALGVQVPQVWSSSSALNARAPLSPCDAIRKLLRSYSGGTSGEIFAEGSCVFPQPLYFYLCQGITTTVHHISESDWQTELSYFRQPPRDPKTARHLAVSLMIAFRKDSPHTPSFYMT